jgi:hypothetical protein
MTAETRREGVGAKATRQRVMLTEEGPVLLSGPVELFLPDGRRVISDRPVTALCTCRRSRRYPICDASHRTKARTNRGPDQPC